MFFYEVKKQSEFYNIYQEVISTKNLKVMIQNTLGDVMFNIREYRCWFDTNGQKKNKSLTQRQFTKSNAPDNIEKNSETRNTIYIIVTFEYVYGTEEVE